MTTYTVNGTITSKGGTDKDTSQSMFNHLVQVFGSTIQSQQETFMKEGMVKLDNIELLSHNEYPIDLSDFINTYNESIGNIHLIVQGDAISDIWQYKMFPDDSLKYAKADIEFHDWKTVR